MLIALPARDEERNLAAVIGELRGAWPAADLLVVDDGSTDGTAAVARGLGARVLSLPFHLGYGAAVQAGIKYAVHGGYGVVVTFDADGQHDPGDIGGLLAALAAGADLAVGSRALAQGSHRGSLARRWGRQLFGALARLLTGLELTDPTSGLKALGPRAQLLYALSRFPDRYPDADALVLAQRARLVIAERPARMRASRNRRSMHGGLRSITYAFNMLFSLLVAATSSERHLRR
ncbi:MAG TPA: glycosyltransferase family 2 protein [Vicinamibacteria bacterium]|nr:glycosyltransferase family 2 protein [Vicinamibacteria bacterium]